MVDYELLGRRIKMKRRSKKRTQKDVADAIRVSPSYYGNIERGLRIPSVDTLVAIANTLGVGTDFLLADSLLYSADRHTPQEMAVLSRYLRERIEELDYGTAKSPENEEFSEEDEAEEDEGDPIED